MSEIQVNTINEYTGANGVSVDGLSIKDGGIQGASGIPLQVVTYQNFITASNLINSTSFTPITYDGTNRLEIKITPKQSDSKILLISNVNTYHEDNDVKWVQAQRDISGGTSDTVIQTYRLRDENQPNAYNFAGPVSYNFVDTPGTTSEVTYHFKGKVEDSSNELRWVSYSADDRGQSFFLWEIGV
tara:strand:+ start:281 stop:838 length:558 start_codon:yes stop_codon:yes gene_type:complete